MKKNDIIPDLEVREASDQAAVLAAIALVEGEIGLSTMSQGALTREGTRGRGG